jgi:hypothetical protein
MTEQNSNEMSLVKAQAQEIQNLNFDGLDVTELERRLEMSVDADVAPTETMDPWICIGYVPDCGRFNVDVK